MQNRLKAGLAAAITLATCGAAAAQDVSPMMVGNVHVVPSVKTDKGQIVIPSSSIPSPGKFHTHYKILVPTAGDLPVASALHADSTATPAATGYAAETPASIACVYKLVPVASGCDFGMVTQNASGGSRAIGIVDAYHNPNSLADLKIFSTQFGLPAPKLQVVYCSATKCGVTTPPATDTSWAGEISLDLQWAHAMAPAAKIILVEANTASAHDLYLAEVEAGKRVAAAGGGVVSNSFGGSEFSTEKQFDQYFKTSGVVYFASTGDKVGTEYPSTSPFVVAVGGTAILRNATTHKLVGEAAWYNSDSSSTGGGLSSVESRPAYQNAVSHVVGGRRGVPDISADADPNSGVYVLCTVCDPNYYHVYGGTSLASPLVAAMVNKAGHFRTSSTAEHQAIYARLGTSSFYDVRAGSCNTGGSVSTLPGYDLCTGVGTPRGLSGF